MTYFIAETQGRHIAQSAWTEIKATSLAGAKRAASQNQMFQGTAVFVGMRQGEEIVAVAVKRADPINMNIKGTWQDI